jgi:hypothetical protein
MKKNILIGILLLLLLALVYFIAFKQGKKEGTQSFVQNYEMVKDIAELGALQVDGKTLYKNTNKEDDVSWSTFFKNTMFEKTVQLEIPYTAKYGINLGKDTFIINQTEEKIIVQLPRPQLLSLDMKLDRIEGIQKTGLLVNESSSEFLNAQKILYTQLRVQLENDEDKMMKTKESLTKILKLYFSPSGKTVEVYFGQSISDTPIKD